jgi:hypothetical protein
VRAFEKTRSSPKFPETEFVAVPPCPLTYNVAAIVEGTGVNVEVLEVFDVPKLYTVVTLEVPDKFTASTKFQYLGTVTLEFPVEARVAITS